MASQQPFPLMPPKSTELRMEHFDEKVYKIGDETTVLYKFLNALCGDAGAGSLKKEIFLQRLSGALDSIYASDLDYVFGNIRFLSRADSEAYNYDPMTQQLTTEKWNEVNAKDAQYRSRIREYFTACTHGNTVEGIRQAVHAAISVDCQVIESWRYIDNFGISTPVGRSVGTSYAATDLTTGHRVFFSQDINGTWSYTSPTNGPGNTSVQTNSLTVGIPNPAWAAAIVANPGNYRLSFNSPGPQNVTIGGITGPASGTNVYTLTGTWPASSTGFPLTISSVSPQSIAQTFINSQTTPSSWAIERVYGRNELTVVPYKATLTGRESRLMLQMLNKMSNLDTVLTIDPNGLQVHSPIKIQAITSDSTYYQVEKIVTGSPILGELPAPELLAIDLDPSENWLRAGSPELAPYAQFNITQEYGYYYLVSGGKRSPIDSVTYGTLLPDGRVAVESNFEWSEESGQYGDWSRYEKADSPDNYPGGKFGLTPTQTPAINRDRSPYQFPYTSQYDYLEKKRAEVRSFGGQAEESRYRLPAQKPSFSKRTYTPDLAIAYTAPVRESTVTSSWSSRKPRYVSTEQRNPSLFVR